MARSLTISQEEKPTTSGLLNAFLFLAFAWLAFAALSSGAAETAQPAVDIVNAE